MSMYTMGVACLFSVVDCGKVPTMLYGSANYINGSTYLGSRLSYSCVRNYRLVGVQSRVCQENGQWSDGSPRCEGEFEPKVVQVKRKTHLEINSLMQECE